MSDLPPEKALMNDNLFNYTTFNGVPNEQIEELFTFWKTTFNKQSRTHLDEPRRKKIASALKSHGAETCRKAILGCSMSDWHTGNNPRNKQYTDLTLILRNADKIESFVELYEQETTASKEMDSWLKS